MGFIDKVCYVFPGQGSQYVGMGKYIYYKHPFVREIFDKSKDILGYDIIKLMFNGPEKKLKETINCQLAILLTNVAYFEVLKLNKEIPPCSLTLGHSIGEYSALVASEALSLEDAIKLVKIRAESMTKCIPKKTSIIKYVDAEKQKPVYMAAVLKNDPNLIGLVEEACEKNLLYRGFDKGVVQIANINSSSQIVISGNNNALIRAAEYLISKNTKIVYLSVEGPFHSELMRPAAEKMKEELEKKEIKISKPKIPFIENNGNLISKPDEIEKALVEQICGTVEWKQSLELAIDMGFTTFIESGPGNVQTKLLERNKDISNVLDVKKYINPNYLLN